MTVTSWDIIVAIVAVYAAILSTGALALEIRRWIETGPRLHLTARAPMITINVPGCDGKQFLCLTVINRGSAPTTLNSCVLAQYPSFWHRWRHKPKKAAVIANPTLVGSELNLPKVLNPGEVWSGYGNYEELKDWLDTGELYVGISASHKDKPLMTKINVIKTANPTDIDEEI